MLCRRWPTNGQRRTGVETVDKRGLKLVWAGALALALFQFALLGKRGGGSFWESHLWPWLSQVLIAAPIVAVALFTSWRLRPRRPERLAAALGGIGGFCFLAVPAAVPLSAFRELEGLISDLSRVLYGLAASGWSFTAPLAVSCWVAANYLRADSWPRFWRGPGGAILKGAIVGGMVGVPAALAGGWYSNQLRSEVAVRYGFHPLPYSWGIHLLMSLSGIAAAAVVAALLVSWRPGAALGAFAGSGLNLGVYVLFLALYAIQPSRLDLGFSEIAYMMSPTFVHKAVLGAVAGVFAGRWEEEKGA